LLDACSEIGAYARSLGSFVAVETGPEPMERLRDFIEDCKDGGMAINYDPANLVMVLCEDEVRGVHIGGKLIVHTHAKDGRNLRKTTGEELYGAFAEGGVEAIHSLGCIEECPLGEGSVRWTEYLGALRDIGFRGFLTIEREVSGTTTTKDIKNGVLFLRRMIENL
jgi:sugar phosphate isomerase/epimerase